MTGPGRFSHAAASAAVLAILAPFAFAQQAAAPPQVTASSVFVMNADTRQVLYAKAENRPFRLHSITKLVTAQVLMKRMGDRLYEEVIVTPAYITSGSSAGLRTGDVWTLENLLYGMLLVSGNDASLAIADRVGRAILVDANKRGNAKTRFVQEMQKAASQLAAKTARFADPHGLSPANVATARDVGTLAATIFRDPRVLPIYECKRRLLDIGGPEARTITLDSTIEILGEDNILAAKTGTHVTKGIYNLVVAWRAPNGQTIIAVVLGSADHAARYRDMRTILAALPQDFPDLTVPADTAQIRKVAKCPLAEPLPTPPKATP
jgi:D-alanyl-D-alanine carboxypeptidase (penicillin-binding protein 5/6)